MVVVVSATVVAGASVTTGSVVGARVVSAIVVSEEPSDPPHDATRTREAETATARRATRFME
jgi:hypothetical protein